MTSEDGAARAAIGMALREALAARHPRVAVLSDSDSPYGGRILLARCRLVAGDVVMSEPPTLQWPMPAAASKSAQGEPLPDALRRGFAAATPVTQAVVSAMCAPAVTPRDALLLHEAAARALPPTADDTDKRDHTAAANAERCRLMLVAKVNAHRVAAVADGEMAAGADASACCDVMSKASHSCAPNCIYDAEQRRYVATAPLLLPGTPITFAYFGKEQLFYGREVRREILARTHLFQCACDRCDAPTDPARGLPCRVTACPGTCLRYDEYHDSDTSTATPAASAGQTVANASAPRWGAAPPIEPWRCGACGTSFADSEMPLTAEHRLAAATVELFKTRALCEKGYFEAVREIMREAVATLGTQHWVYLLLCHCAMDFYVSLLRTKRVSAFTADTVREMCVRWAVKAVAACDAQGVTAAAPLAVADLAVRAASAGHGCAAVRPAVVALLAYAKLVMPAFGTVVAGSDAATFLTDELASTTLLDTAVFAPVVDARSRGAVPPPTFAEAASMVTDDGWCHRAAAAAEADVFAEWEKYLQARVARAAASGQLNSLPPQLRAAMGVPSPQ